MHAYTQVSAKGFDSAAAGQRDSWELSSHFDRAEGRGSFKSQRGVKGIPGILNIDMLPAIERITSLAVTSSVRWHLPCCRARATRCKRSSCRMPSSGGCISRSRRARTVKKPWCSLQTRQRKRARCRFAGRGHCMIVEYVAQDAYLVPRLMEVTLTPSKTVALASLTSTDLQGVLDRGQQIKIYNTLMRTAHNQGRVGNNNLRWKDRVPDLSRCDSVTARPRLSRAVRGRAAGGACFVVARTHGAALRTYPRFLWCRCGLYEPLPKHHHYVFCSATRPSCRRARPTSSFWPCAKWILTNARGRGGGGTDLQGPLGMLAKDTTAFSLRSKKASLRSAKNTKS